ncbi:hypothetical protein CU098_010545 [Rhizopus stolonifer]|uniref:Uncharacterized protein n=1 Tax=Rhizopus stolonifer TaxID=4846 RepID=A0A367KR03_RHIST|nr:hypothetical protein CU098_010545 [Rhizopus stolonifer]
MTRTSKSNGKSQKDKMVLGTSSSSNYAISSDTISNNLTKTLEQAVKLVTDHLAQLGIIDLILDLVWNILKMCTTEEQYESIILSVNVKEFFSYKNLHNTLYPDGYKQDHDVMGDCDVDLDLVESPKNPLDNRVFERSAVIQTSIVITSYLFLVVNGTVELG